MPPLRPIIPITDITDGSYAEMTDAVSQLFLRYERTPIIGAKRPVRPFSVLNGAYHVGLASGFWGKDENIKPVVLGVVDPGVGSDRLPIIIDTEKVTFVGPNNGLAHFLCTSFAIKYAGIIHTNERRVSQGSTNTFDGRDLFAPVAARIAMGTDPKDISDACKTEQIIKLDLKNGIVLEIDNFGNIKIFSSISIEKGEHYQFQVERAIGGMRETTHTAMQVTCFNEQKKGALVTLSGSSNVGGMYLQEIAIVQGNATQALGGIDIGDRIIRTKD